MLSVGLDDEEEDEVKMAFLKRKREPVCGEEVWLVFACGALLEDVVVEEEGDVCMGGNVLWPFEDRGGIWRGRVQ
jgi:hypothetical protein